MRTIKFRALTSHTRKWVYGYLNLNADIPVIWQADKLPSAIDRKTVGQYTGLKDKNGKEIWEGDLMLYPAGAPENVDSYMTVKFGLMRDVRWGFYLDYYGGASTKDVFESHEVIGNIYENKDLLKEDQ